jgi:hypothetical protein
MIFGHHILKTFYLVLTVQITTELLKFIHKENGENDYK